MIKNIIKRDGRIEPYNPDKLNDWGKWGTSQFNVNWIPIVQSTERLLNAIAEQNDGNVRSDQIHETVINKCLSIETYEGYMMAGKFYGASLPREIYGTKRHPTIKQVHQSLINDGLMRPTGYSDEEYTYLEEVIDHSLDLVAMHYSLDFIRKKYALKNWVSGKEYETPQFTLMRMAMALCDDEPQGERLTLVEDFYKDFSGKDDLVGFIPNKKLSAPSPNYTNLGTYSQTYASCCLYAIGDSIPSLSAGHLIAHEMTAASAGLGLSMRTRSIKDPVRRGAIEHLGKKPYIDAQSKLALANKQGSRGGAMTLQFPITDPEVDLLTYLRNPRTPTASRNRDIHYAWIDNTFIAKKVGANEKIFLFNDYNAPELMKLFYDADVKAFEAEYNRLEQDPTFKKTYRNARDLIVNAEAEGFHTGTFYYMNATESNRHTPFKETIDSSNLCVAEDTILTTKEGAVVIKEKAGQYVEVWNGEQWSKSLVEKTGENQNLLIVETSNGQKLECTLYHKWYVINTSEKGNKYIKEVRTYELFEGIELAPYKLPDGTVISSTVTSISRGRSGADTYCVNEPIRHKAIFNGILTGQCMEILQPKFPYAHPKYLYDVTDHGKGEISTCNLGAINVSFLDLTPENDAKYRRAAYLALKMIDKTINLSKFPFDHLNFTSRQRMNAAVGMMGVATLMARNNMRYDTPEGLEFADRLAERHMYFLIEASLKLSQERGLAPWIHKTKWPEGWLPIDTYNKNVDELVPLTLRYGWENLRSRIIENGGIGHSVLCAHMPGESSSKGLQATNSYYPVREPVMVKTDGIVTSRWAAYMADGIHYQSAWDVDLMAMVKYTAVLQKWCDSGISYDQHLPIGKADKVKSTEVLDIYFAMHKYGIKTRYYINTNTATDNLEEAKLNVNTGFRINDDELLAELELTDGVADCDSCAL